MFGIDIDIDIFYITSYIVFAFSILFLWLTAVSGVKFYQLDIGKKDAKSIKLLIHITMLAGIASFLFVCFEKELNVQKVESGEETEEVQKKTPAKKHRPDNW